jgi:prepilin-type N-terminal cleavage/methylation domain-containing protein
LKRKGFTLIELMVVIAIIIILAAIAIPNYLNMTARAKKSRVQSDMATIATALETYKTDWGQYPASGTSGTTGAAEAVNDPESTVFKALAGPDDGTSNQGGTGADLNVKDGTPNAVGEAPPINYIKYGTLKSMTNPIVSGTNVMYASKGGASGWVLYAADAGTSNDTSSYMYRTDAMSTPSETGTEPKAP